SPAASDTEQSMIETDAQCFARRTQPSPAGIDEPERCSAALQTAIFERAELKCARDGQHGRTNDPSVQRQPTKVACRNVDEGIGGMRNEPECRPGGGVAEHDQREQRGRVSASGGDTLKYP